MKLSSVVSTVRSSFLRVQSMCLRASLGTHDTWITHPARPRTYSLDNCAFLHGEPYPVLALGPIALPVGVCIAICQAGHIELLLG